MAGSRLRRLQELAAQACVKAGPSWRATKEANLVGCLSESNEHGRMKGSRLRRLQELAAQACVKAGPSWRATKEANLVGCLSESQVNTDYDRQPASPTAGASRSSLREGWPKLASDEGGESGWLPVRVQVNTDYDRQPASPPAGASRSSLREGWPKLASDEGGESGWLPVRVQVNTDYDRQPASPTAGGLPVRVNRDADSGSAAACQLLTKRLQSLVGCKRTLRPSWRRRRRGIGGVARR